MQEGAGVPQASYPYLGAGGREGHLVWDPWAPPASYPWGRCLGASCPACPELLASLASWGLLVSVPLGHQV